MATEDKLRVVILHGAHGGPDTNWFPWLATKGGPPALPGRQ